MSRPARTVEERLWPRIDAEGPCWLWTGAKNRGGYGVINPGGSGHTAIVHRLVWTLLVGPIAREMDLDHLCRVRSCCNPDHLEPVTHAENVARGSYRAGARRTFRCDHPETPENTALNRNGNRTCRTCRNEAHRRYRARKAAA